MEDNQLVYEVIRGNNSSYEVLLDRYQKKIYNMVLRMVGNTETAKDLTQDIFVKVYEKLGSFNSKYRFFSWIYRISINETVNWIKRNPRHYGLNAAQDLPDSDNESDRAERRIRMLDSSLQELPSDYRILLVLKYYNGLSYEEIAVVNDLPVKKLRSRLFIAREQLRRILLNKGFLENE